MLVLHEREPEAADFMRELAGPGRAGRRARAAGSTSTRWRSAASRAGWRRCGRRSCTRTSSTATRTGSRPACWRGCRTGSRRSTASTSSATAGSSPGATAPCRASRDCQIAISAGSGGVPGRARGIRRGRVRGRPLRDRGRPGAASAAVDAAPPVHRPADPDQGPPGAARGVRGRARGGAGADARPRRHRPARAGAACCGRRGRPLPRPRRPGSSR